MLMTNGCSDAQAKANWRDDSHTRRWLSENSELLERSPRDLDAHFLAEADYYCSSQDNPYMREILIRANLLDEYGCADGAIAKSAVADAAGRKLGVVVF